MADSMTIEKGDKSYRRMSGTQAAAYAIELAETFLAGQDPASWQWEVSGESPVMGLKSGRKASPVWRVCVRWRGLHGEVIDGPSLIEVDLTTCKCRFLETP